MMESHVHRAVHRHALVRVNSDSFVCDIDVLINWLVRFRTNRRAKHLSIYCLLTTCTCRLRVMSCAHRCFIDRYSTFNLIRTSWPLARCVVQLSTTNTMISVGNCRDSQVTTMNVSIGTNCVTTTITNKRDRRRVTTYKNIRHAIVTYTSLPLSIFFSFITCPHRSTNMNNLSTHVSLHRYQHCSSTCHILCLRSTSASDVCVTHRQWNLRTVRLCMKNFNESYKNEYKSCLSNIIRGVSTHYVCSCSYSRWHRHVSIRLPSYMFFA
jgi:hypothetical protein